MAYQNTSDCDEGIVDIGSPLVTNTQSSELVQPTQCTFHYPTMNAQAAVVRGISFGDDGVDANFPQCTTIRLRIVAAIGIQFGKAIARGSRPTLDRRNRIHQRQQFLNVMPVGRCRPSDNRRALSIGQQVMLGTGLSPVCGVGTGLFAPPTARSEALSTTQREKSIFSAWRRWFKRMW